MCSKELIELNNHTMRIPYTTNIRPFNNIKNNQIKNIIR